MWRHSDVFRQRCYSRRYRQDSYTKLHPLYQYKSGWEDRHASHVPVPLKWWQAGAAKHKWYMQFTDATWHDFWVLKRKYNVLRPRLYQNLLLFILIYQKIKVSWCNCEGWNRLFVQLLLLLLLFYLAVSQCCSFIQVKYRQYNSTAPNFRFVAIISFTSCKKIHFAWRETFWNVSLSLCMIKCWKYKNMKVPAEVILANSNHHSHSHQSKHTL